jgi:acetyl-CoA carboxylase biotin carboxyl carrier protein
MALSEKELLQILEMFQQSSWQDMQLQSGSIKLSISKTGRPQPVARTEVMSSKPGPAVQSTTAPTVLAPTKPTAPIDPRWVAIKAPLLGTFYAAPKPGAPPFVTLGQTVTPDDTVAILDVMKLMNHVKAGVAGRIAHIAVANGDLVEFEQLMFYIDATRD